MKFHSLPFIAWIAISFGLLLLMALLAIHHFHQAPFAFMPAAAWWLDFAGLAVSTSVWLHRAAHRSTPMPA
jgi:hypothetical protein